MYPCQGWYNENLHFVPPRSRLTADIYHPWRLRRPLLIKEGGRTGEAPDSRFLPHPP
jgi:hypothetical protein